MSRWDGVRKEIARNRTARPDAHYKNIITLPGEKLLDIEVFLEQGSIDYDTNVVMIESDKKTAAKIKCRFLNRFADRLPNYELFIGKLTDYQPKEPLDFLNLDLMGSLNPILLDWISELPLQRGCDISLNLASPRNNKAFYDQLYETFLLYGSGKEFYRKTLDKFYHLRSWSDLDCINITTILATLFRYHPTVLPQEEGDVYKDHVNRMHFYRFWNIQKTDKEQLTLRDMMHEKSNVHSATIKHSTGEKNHNELTSLARQWVKAEQTQSQGLMAYVAMRKNQLRETAILQGKCPIRALAAVKAWKTRIENGMKELTV